MKRGALVATIALTLTATSASAQTVAFSADLLRDLPAGANLFSILETTQAEIVTDRFNSGGLNAGEGSRVGGFFASWSQTRFRIGDVDISSANGGPLLFPDLALWQHIHITSALTPATMNAPGLAIAMAPKRPAARWTGTFEGYGAGGRLISHPPSTSIAPPIVRLKDWAHGNAVVSGPLVDQRLGVLIAGSWTSNTRFEREAATVSANTKSVFTNVVFNPKPTTELRTLVWVQQGSAGNAQTRSAHAQSSIETRQSGGATWQIVAGYTRRSRTFDEDLADGVVLDRLVDGPIPTLVADSADVIERRTFVGASGRRARGRHQLQAGADADLVAARIGHAFTGRIFESVDGHPAREWQYSSPPQASERNVSTFGVFVNDRTSVTPRVTIDAHVRWETIRGSARGATTDITWHALLPSASLRWELGTRCQLSLVTGYGRSANRLQLGLLAFGDPAAPTARVFRWDHQAPLVARMGPGTGGDAEFSGINPQLKRSHTDEFAIGLESRPRKTLRLAVTGIARRQTALINVVNIGVPLETYASFTVPDANVDLVKPSDDQQLRVYNRQPETFGRDRYLLTNPEMEPSTLGAVLITAQVASERLFLLIGATAAAAVGSGGNRGFRASENDQDVVGELFSNPNAATYARGRLFSDRAYTIKWTTIYRFPREIRLGAIARYQDGQPFSRLVVVPGLNQGVEAVQAFANGRSRFAFTGTLDVRLHKGFHLGAMRLDAMVDAYNVLNMRKEVEEYVVTGPAFRRVTATQPPRAFHLGARVTF